VGYARGGVADTPKHSLWRRVRWPALGLVLALAYGVMGYMLLEEWRFLDALYMTVITLTTVGFREVRPLDDTGIVFTISLITIGVGLVLVTITVIAQWVLEGHFGETTRRKRMQRRLDKLGNHLVVCGYGRVGRAVARELEAEHAAFSVIERGEDLVDQMEADGVAHVFDDATRESALRKAGVERARGLVCAVDSDATNVYIALVARGLNPELFIVARASEPGSDQRLLAAGADRVVSPFVSSGRHMALVAMRPRVSDVVEFETPDTSSITLEQIRIESGSPFADRDMHDAFGGVPVLAVRHAGGEITVNPPPDARLLVGDIVLTLGEAELTSVVRAPPPVD
jgi:voltage-gated potassium channel